MKYARTIALLALWLIIVPWLGFPTRWEQLLIVIPAVFLFILAVLLAQSHHHHVQSVQKENEGKAHTDSKPTKESSDSHVSTEGEDNKETHDSEKNTTHSESQ